jgi:hypothetical protein
MHHLSMSPCHRQRKLWLRRARKGAAAPRIDRSLTKPPRHCLCMVGLGLDVDQCPKVHCLI